MDFTDLMKSMQARVCASPLKWSHTEVSGALDECTKVNDVNRIIRFCPYDQLSDNGGFAPSRSLVEALVVRAGLGLSSPTVAANHLDDIQRDLTMAIQSKHLTPKSLWKVCAAKGRHCSCFCCMQFKMGNVLCIIISFTFGTYLTW